MKTPDGYVDVPENLVDDVNSGKLDLTSYTHEQLRQMSIDRHKRSQPIRVPFDDSNNYNKPKSK